MTPEQEAAQILTRILESLARASGKTLKPDTCADIQRMCKLLSGAGYDDLDDLPRVESPEYIPASAAIPKDWMEQRERERRGR